MPYILGTLKDSLRASRQMREQDFAAIIVMGGDGTSRVVTKACGDVPLVSVSTGTNNVFPQMVEGTLAGLGAGAIATGTVDLDKGCQRATALEYAHAGGGSKSWINVRWKTRPHRTQRIGRKACQIVINTVIVQHYDLMAIPVEQVERIRRRHVAQRPIAPGVGAQNLPTDSAEEATF